MSSKWTFSRYLMGRLRVLCSASVFVRTLFKGSSNTRATELEIMKVLRGSPGRSMNTEIEKLMTEIIKLKETERFQKKIIEINSIPSLNKRDKKFYTTMVEWWYLEEIIDYLRNELTKALGKPKLKHREETIREGLRRLIQRSKELEQKGRGFISTN